MFCAWLGMPRKDMVVLRKKHRIQDSVATLERHTGKILVRYWKDTAKILLRYC
jgi:hypothetical protein